MLWLLYCPALTSALDYWKAHCLDYVKTLSVKWCLYIFNILSRFVVAFLSRSSHLLISWLQSPSAVILEPRKKKSVTAFSLSLSTCLEMTGQIHDLSFFFFNVEFKPLFHSPPSPSPRGSLVSLHFPPLEIYVEVSFWHQKECEILLAFNRQRSEMLISSNIWDSSK